MVGTPGKSGGGNRTSGLSKLPLVKSPVLVKPEEYLDPSVQLSQQEIFDRLAKRLQKLGVTLATDSHVLTMLAQQYHILQEATRIYDEQGIEGMVGKIQVHVVITESQKRVDKLLREWNLTPSLRGNIDQGSGDADEAFANLLAFDPRKKKA